jgi:Phage capsid family
LLQDAPAARSLIDGQLRLGLQHKVEDLAATALQAGTYTKVTGASKQSLLEVARLGIAQVQTNGFRPNALVCSPEDAANFDLYLLSKTLNGAAMGAPVWGLNIVPVPGVTKPYLGDFRIGLQMIERTGTDIYVTDSHADTFIKNVFTILAETRVKPVVVQPAAIVELTVTP